MDTILSSSGGGSEQKNWRLRGIVTGIVVLGAAGGSLLLFTNNGGKNGGGHPMSKGQAASIEDTLNSSRSTAFTFDGNACGSYNPDGGDKKYRIFGVPDVNQCKFSDVSLNLKASEEIGDGFRKKLQGASLLRLNK